MATYGMKDAANLVLINKATKQVSLFIDYANATSSEWSAERVYATKKGTNAIAWDSNRQGTLSIDTEVFDLSYLALAIGSDIATGNSDIMMRKAVTIDETRSVTLDGIIEPESVSVIKLQEDMIEHDGTPIPALTGQRDLIPEIVRDVSVGLNENSALITFSPSRNAVSYEILQDDEVVATVPQNAVTIEGLTPSNEYSFAVRAINEYGTSALSAVIKATTPEEGVTGRVNHVATPDAILDAEAQEGKLNEMASNMVTFEVNGNTVRFNDKALVGEHYAIYYLEEIDNVRTITVSADKFPATYEIYADALIREQETGADEFVQFHYKNARPQSNFTLTQSATEPTSLSVVFDLFPDKDKTLAEFKVIDGVSDTPPPVVETPDPVIRTEEAVEVIDEVEFDTVENDTDELPFGETVTVQEGSNGYTEVTYLITYRDDIESSRTEIKRDVVEPIDEIINVGTGIVTTKEVTDKTDIVPFDTVDDEDETLELGKTEVIQEGKDGYTEVTYLVTYIDGEEADREEKSRNVVEPVDKIVRVGLLEEVEETETETIPFDTTETDDDTIPLGDRVTKTEGVNGTKTLTYLVSYVKGNEVKRELLEEKVTKEPVTEEILVGTLVEEETDPEDGD